MILANLSIPDDVTRLVNETGPVDVLVANAGVPASGSLLDYSDTEIAGAHRESSRTGAPGSTPGSRDGGSAGAGK